jgi:hypothetical protein
VTIGEQGVHLLAQPVIPCKGDVLYDQQDATPAWSPLGPGEWCMHRISLAWRLL